MKNSKGEILEDTFVGPAVRYVHGGKQVLPALQRKLEGAEAGEKKVIKLSKNEGIDGIDDDFTIEVVVQEVRLATPEELQNGLMPTFPARNCNSPDCC